MRDFSEGEAPQPAAEAAAPVFNPNAAIVQSVKRACAFIEFEPDGTIVRANENFLAAVGYREEEIAGRHHRIFMPPGEADTAEYRDFWRRLGQGAFVSGKYRRVRKDGTPIWISATYSPIHDREGTVRGVFKIAIDLSEEKRLHEAIAAALAGLAHGDLGGRLPTDFDADGTRLATAFNVTLAKLERVFAGFSDGTDALDALAASLSGRAGDLTGRAERLAGAIRQSSARTTELTAAAEAMSARVEASDGKVRRAAESSARGAGTVQQAVASMKAIEAITADISKITRVIEGFAFQTNLLSINAAVEAARAGDAGKGFAVVATEVRNLAERSAKASQEIADLISRSEVEVGRGVTHVGNAGAALTEIDAAVADVVSGVEAIESGVRAQVRGIGEVRATLEEMAQETTRVAGMADENGAAAGTLGSAVAALVQHVRDFAGPR